MRTSHRVRGALVAGLVTAVVATVAACGSGSGSGSGTGSTEGNPTLPLGGQEVAMDPADFTTRIDNPYWPMEPGTRWTYRETDEDGAKLKVVVVVTTKTKKVANGITGRVVRDTVYDADGSIVEDTFDFYAQDKAGNVWYLGEETAEFEDGEIASREGSFEVGVDGALAGIAMPANPRSGMRYRQEYLKGEAEDNGEVLSVNEMVEIALGAYEDVLLTKDTITIEPDVAEYKFYAKGVGPVLVLGISGGGGREELIKMDKAPATAGTGPLGSPNP